MKILRIIARLNVGGPARHVVWLTQGLRDMGCEVVLVAGVVPPGEEDMSYVASASRVVPVTLPEMSREISLKDALTIWKLYRIMLRERPDIVHTHTAKAGAVGRVAGMIYRYLTPSALIGKPRACKFVHTYHGHVFHSYYGPRKTRIFLAIERMLAWVATDRIIVLGEQQRSEINEHFRVGFREQFRVIPLGIDLSDFANWEQRRPQMRAELNARDDDVLIGIVGRLTQIKNHSLFLRAAARLKEQNRNSLPGRPRFVIIGDGNLRGELESEVLELALNDDVLFLGTRNDPEYFYPALDIVALTSLNEGTPLTLIEAMANARPVISTAVGGVVDLLGRPETNAATAADAGFIVCERGISVRSNDTEGFGKGLEFLIENEITRRRLGERGRIFVEQQYSKDRLISDTNALYEGLIEARPAVADNQNERRHVAEEKPDLQKFSA